MFKPEYWNERIYNIRLICKIIYVTKLMNFKKSFAKIIYVKVLNYSNICFILGEF